MAARVLDVRRSLPPREGVRSRLGYMSVEDFAEQLGTGKSRVIAWEKGEAYPDEVNAQRLADASAGRYTPADFARDGDRNDLEASRDDLSRKIDRLIDLLTDRLESVEAVGRSNYDLIQETSAATAAALQSLDDRLSRLEPRRGVRAGRTVRPDAVA